MRIKRGWPKGRTSRGNNRRFQEKQSSGLNILPLQTAKTFEFFFKVQRIYSAFFLKKLQPFLYTRSKDIIKNLLKGELNIFRNLVLMVGIGICEHKNHISACFSFDILQKLSSLLFIIRFKNPPLFVC